MHRTAALPLLAALALSAAGCGGPLYTPCTSQVGCAEGLRCIDVGGEMGAICTRSCTVRRDRAGFPDALDQDALFEEGTTTQQTVSDSRCAEGDVEVVSQDADGEQQISVSGEVVGVCRISPEQAASAAMASDSTLSGWCTPL